MNVAIVQNYEHLDYSSKYDFLDIIEWSDYQDFHEYKHFHEEEVPRFEWIISEIEKTAANLDVLILSNFLKDYSESFMSDKNSYIYSAFELALHIRLHEKEEVKSLPIIVFSHKTVEEIISSSYNILHILGTHGLFLINPDYFEFDNVSLNWKTENNDEHHVKPAIITMSQILKTCDKKTIQSNYELGFK